MDDTSFDVVVIGAGPNWSAGRCKEDAMTTRITIVVDNPANPDEFEIER
ncbi:hypothetical protein [Plantactinospora sp. WMMB782]